MLCRDTMDPWAPPHRAQSLTRNHDSSRDEFPCDRLPPAPAGEYAPYYERYISLLGPSDAPGNDVLAAFDDQRRQTLLLLSGRTESDGDFRYAPEKWNLKEVLGHINDTERIMSYRALRISRGDKTPIEGFEQDDYVGNAPFARLALAD